MVKINFNDTALRYTAQHQPADREGRLLYRTSKDSYRERWFRLCGNLLFYFRTNDLGAVVDMGDPVGVLVLAGAPRVQMEVYGDRPFVFSVAFAGEEGRKHFFSGQSQQQCQEWVQALSGCGYSKLQTELESLRLQIKDLTGKDPLLDRTKIPKPLQSGFLQSSSGSAATFYVGSSSDRRSPSSFSTSVPIVPTRRAPNRPTQATQLLIDLADPTADAADSAQVHTSATKAATFTDWESFH